MTYITYIIELLFIITEDDEVYFYRVIGNENRIMTYKGLI